MQKLSTDDRPTLKIVRGDAAPEEVAAIVAALAVRTEAQAGQERDTPGGWRDRAHQMRRPIRPAPGAWRAAGWW